MGKGQAHDRHRLGLVTGFQPVTLLLQTFVRALLASSRACMHAEAAPSAAPSASWEVCFPMSAVHDPPSPLL